MSITNPSQLIAEFKKSGEFDRLRREMLSDFQRSEAVRPLLSRVEEIARQKLQGDRKLEYLPQVSVHRELIAELDRYPLVERAVGEFRARSERMYPSEVRASLRNLLRDSQKRGTKDEPARKVEEPIKPPATVTASVAPPVYAEEHIKKRYTDDVGVGVMKKNGDEDAMDVEQVPAHPPKETTSRNPAKVEHSTDQPTLTDKDDVEEGAYVH